jgi:transcription elongation factor Elf1
MFVIFGTSTRTKELSHGEFPCPRCGQTRHYIHRAQALWFSLFFIPILILKDMGEEVVCAECGTMYDTGVLSR